jgi:hypothetical protein
MNHNTKVEPSVELRRIPVAAIERDPAIQQRVAGTSTEVVEEYAQAMRDGDVFPPPVVFSTDGLAYHLGDGFHRVEAYRLAHPDAHDIACDVHPGDHDDAFLFACGANGSHGLPRSNSDKRKAVLALLSSEKWAHWSDREIARRCRVSPPFVSKLRDEHLASLPDGAEDHAASPPPTPQTRPRNAPVTPPSRRRTAIRHGKPYPMRTANIGAARTTPNRPQSSEAKWPLTSLAWSMATKPDRVKFVSAVGGREIVEAFKSIEPRFDMLEWSWRSAGQTEREEFAKAHYEEIQLLADAPDDRLRLRELKPDDDPLAIPTLLRRAKV